jgi:hypothetical protein
MSMLVISIVLEAAVAIVAVLAARKGKPYIYGLAFSPVFCSGMFREGFFPGSSCSRPSPR